VSRTAAIQPGTADTPVNTIDDPNEAAAIVSPDPSQFPQLMPTPDGETPPPFSGQPAAGQSDKNAAERSNINVINGPADGLAQYVNGNGATATLGANLLDSVKQYGWYKEIINNVIPTDVAKAVSGLDPLLATLGQNGSTITIPAHADAGYPTGPIGLWSGGLSLPCGNPGYDPTLNLVTGGTIIVGYASTVTILGFIMPEFDPTQSQTVALVSVKTHFTLNKHFSLKGGHNTGFNAIVGMDYNIHNEWDENMVLNVPLKGGKMQR